MAVKKHIVVQGECLSLIAMRHGQTWEQLWAMPENQHLHELRGDPDVLYPGDEVYYRDLEEKEEPGDTENRHRYRLRGIPYRLALTIYDTKHVPKANVKWSIDIEGTRTPEQVTAEDGMIEETIQPGVDAVTLYLGDLALPLKLRHLDPANQTTGIQQRLGNLGYDVGPVDGVLGPRTREALRAYQSVEMKAGLEASGEPDPETVKNLRELHEAVVLEGKPNAFQDGPSPKPPASAPGEDPDDGGEVEDDDSDDEEDDTPPVDYTEYKRIASDAGRSMPVACLQQMLRDMGYPPGPVDGIYGPLTSSGVRSFQTDYDLLVDGIAGPQTYTALREVYNAV